MNRLSKIESGLLGAASSPKAHLDDVSGLHKYWARKPWRVLDHFVNKYSNPGDIILDPFMGSGSSGLQANLNGRGFIGIDLNPLACFLARATLSETFDDEGFRNDLLDLERSVKSEIMDLYRCEDRYALWSKPRDEKFKEGLLATFDFKEKVRSQFELKTISRNSIKGVFPDAVFPAKFYKDRFSYKGVRLVSDLYTNRNLKALSILWAAINSRGLSDKKSLLLAFSNTLLHVSKLKSEGVRPLGVNNYWLPDDAIEENVWWRFIDRAHKVRKAKLSIAKEKSLRPLAITSFKVLNSSSVSIPEIAENSVDYILTDPPYGDAIQYSELSFVWNTWLELPYDSGEEVIVNPVQNKSNFEYLALLESALQEMYRTLKDKKFATIAFHTRDINLWLGLAKLLNSCGFSLNKIDAFPPKGNPFTRNWAKFSPKTDIYITVQKTAGHHNSKALPVTFTKIVCEVADHLRGREVPTSLRFDLLVATMFDYQMRNREVIDLPRSRTIEALLQALQQELDA